jgi:hypothetical protein
LLEGNDLPAYLSEVPSSTVFMLHFTTQKPENLHEVYSGLEAVKGKLPFQIRLFPSLEELLHERKRVPEIKMLDRIAEHAEPDFSFRPITCFGEGSCALSGHEITYEKRSHSGSGSHLNEVRGTGCPSRLSALSTVSRGFSTLHQQYITHTEIVRRVSRPRRWRPGHWTSKDKVGSGEEHFGCKGGG